jgi:hypothetical protein
MALMQKAQKPFKLKREAHGCKAFSGSFPSSGAHTAMAGLRLPRSQGNRFRLTVVVE